MFINFVPNQERKVIISTCVPVLLKGHPPDWNDGLDLGSLGLYLCAFYLYPGFEEVG